MIEQRTGREEVFSNDPNRAWDWPQGTDWAAALGNLFNESWMCELKSFVIARRQLGAVFPVAENVFRALIATPISEVKFVILGQDPYHDEGQAQGISFSVPRGIKHPPSLRNIFREYSSDTGYAVPLSGDLTPWARQGGLLLNSVLTVDAHLAHSHCQQGWEQFTDKIISMVSDQGKNIAFVLWGKPAQEKRELIDTTRHLIIEAPHPSPLSAHRGFFGSKPFSIINAWRKELGLSEINWRL